MEFKTVTLSYQNNIALLTLDRPEKRNAISFELIDDIMAALDAVDASSASILIITGAGRAFCSGMDLENLRQITSRTAEDNQKDSETIAHLFRRIYEFPKTTIAAVNGAAVAGGCGIATFCDFTIASTEAKFGYTEVRIGFVPAIVSCFLVRQVGEKQARDLLLTGRIIDATEAYRIGLITEAVEPEALMTRVHQLATELLQNSPSSLLATKRLLAGFAFEDLNHQLAAAVEENARIRTTVDFNEGITSFLEKRKPVWQGK